MKSIFKTLIEFAFGLHLNLDLKTKNRKGILLEKLLFFPFWPNLGTSPAASLPSLARSAHFFPFSRPRPAARWPSSFPLPALACSTVRSARPASCLPLRTSPVPRGPSHAGLLRTPAPLWPSAPTPAVSTRKLFLSRCPAGPACQPDTLLPSSSFPFFPVLSFLRPSMAHTKTASRRITAPARKAPIS